MKFSKSPSWLVDLFTALQEEVGGTPRQMFGYPCAFENGQLFTGLFQDGMFVRLGEAERARLLAEKGAKQFEPMMGRPMREYVVLPPPMLEDEEAVKSWMQRGLEFARSLPPKSPAKKSRKKH
ncbi:MAG: TfoX/Sxy family protein [Deltaproteobacteria bacterium]|nr:MAG: TfoX/Sxy family protein [Deltaproteobacteria bacterium]